MTATNIDTTAIASELATLDSLADRIANLQSQAIELDCELRAAKARFLAALARLGLDSYKSPRGDFTARPNPSGIELAGLSDREFARRFPELCKPDSAAIRRELPNRPELADVAIPQPPSGMHLRFKATD